ncbi:hypothetical protein [Paenibacillus piscarius]|uniref:hypothetical protein n=1 Tax=Paenibacillus piscarius TaxID=1089681 RepID=UPI001EE7EEE3|nr:hypothetical protein [Paenibacillus piscarius]
MYTKKLIMALSLTLSLLVLNACSNSADAPPAEPSPDSAPTAEATVAPAASDEPEQTPEATDEPEQTPEASAEPEQTPEQSDSGGSTASISVDIPKELPKDFPMPDNVTENVMSTTAKDEGKTSVMLIYRTSDSMEAVTKLYDDYLSAQMGDQSVKTIDAKNLIIQGKTKDNKHSWSVIAGPLASQEGIVEVNVLWSEI